MPQRAALLPVSAVRATVIAEGTSGATAEGERLTIGTAADNDLVLQDETVSRYHAELRADGAGIVVRDMGSRNGIRVGEIVVREACVPPGQRLHLGGATVRVERAGLGQVPILGGDSLAGIRARSPAMRRVLEQVRLLAPASAAVLIIGESGTGKERVAQALHELSERSGGPFVTVDCGALSPTLLLSDLFGHERGAFTGATSARAGAFERAHGGTLFLDEVGELPLDQQATLLGVLERRRYRRLGGTTEHACDVRLVAATHRDLRGAVNAGRFRLDLYYRLAVVTLELPPLRERPEDIPLLIEEFLRQMGEPERAPLFQVPELLARLEHHSWPGNVRELRNVVEATLALGEAPPLRGAPAGPADRTERLRADMTSGLTEGQSYGAARRAAIARFERLYLRELMERADGNLSKASRLGQIDRAHLRNLLRRHGLR